MWKFDKPFYVFDRIFTEKSLLKSRFFWFSNFDLELLPVVVWVYITVIVRRLASRTRRRRFLNIFIQSLSTNERLNVAIVGMIISEISFSQKLIFQMKRSRPPFSTILSASWRFWRSFERGWIWWWSFRMFRVHFAQSSKWADVGKDWTSENNLEIAIDKKKQAKRIMYRKLRRS